MTDRAELIRQIIPLWYAHVAWAEELLTRVFQLETASDILHREHRGRRQVSGTNWFIRTHGIGVDIFKAPNVGGIDFDFDKPDPDPWRLQIFFEKQIREGNLPYSEYRELAEDKDLLEETIKEVMSRPPQEIRDKMECVISLEIPHV